VNTGADRAEVVAALSAVDAVVVFDEDAPDAIISALQPDVLANGADRADEAAAKTLQRVRAVGK
jgi:D-beta-D-heptose 7-phosphate kinase/D-beta-D-heptose 1-phosphate adenosyltransferase